MIKITREFLSFIVAGGFAAIVNIISRAILSNFLNFENSIIIAYMIGMVVAFYITKKFVFVSKNNISKSFAAFALVNLAAVAQTFFISLWSKNIILPFLGITIFVELLSHIAGVFFPVFTSFFGHKYISFGKISK